VLLNLLGNAVKFTESGAVTFRVSATNKILSAHGGLSSLVFEVFDTGSGIAPAFQEKIFTPFEQAGDLAQKAVGTGLGLAISRRLVELMGGTLSVQSEPGKGSTFRFEINLPVVEVEEDAAETLSSRKIRGYQGDPRTILIVEDDKTNQQMMALILESIDLRVLVAGNGREAIRIAKSSMPDLILMDLAMPVMGGLEAITALSKLDQVSKIPIIVVSASVHDEERERCQMAGCSNFLPKPVKFDLLVSLLGKLLGLKWCYEDCSNQGLAEILTPPAGELDELEDLVQLGSMANIERWASALVDRDGQYRPFAEQLQRWAIAFEEKKIRDYLWNIRKGEKL
jgi:CheY-like chemotaxis protein